MTCTDMIGLTDIASLTIITILAFLARRGAA